MKFKGKVAIVKEVQTTLGLNADGIAGVKTWKMIWENLVHDEKGEPEKPEPPVVDLKDDYPEVYKPSPNKSGTIKPRFIVLHHSSGSHDGTRSWILNPSSEVSYHYLIAADGSRTQFVYDTKRAWHAGRSKWDGISGLNGYSVGISFYGNTHTRTPSVVEIDSAAKKCIYLMKKFNIGIDGIVTHKMVSPGRKDDPSDETYDLVIARIKTIAG
jgi:N-acetyl-anhydromuramyl-L-alanine amidase AmpD|tara:strand:- start:455 stop:1093 length:639 start_codon:yes stop_codon:yes gene_type:complete